MIVSTNAWSCTPNYPASHLAIQKSPIRTSTNTQISSNIVESQAMLAVFHNFHRNRTKRCLPTRSSLKASQVAFGKKLASQAPTYNGTPAPTGSDRLSVVELKSVGEAHLAAAHTGIGIAKVFIADLAPGPILSWMT